MITNHSMQEDNPPPPGVIEGRSDVPSIATWIRVVFGIATSGTRLPHREDTSTSRGVEKVDAS
jgi:hypothetical protein